VTVVSAPAGSGKTVLLRSCIAEAGLAEHVAWVPVQGGERDPQRFWISVADALRDTTAGSKLVQGLTAAPDLDAWAIAYRLLADLESLEDRIWLVIDDVHELCSAEALRQLQLLLMRAPSGLRFVLAARQDVRLGLHRLRLEGELTEIRAGDLRFTVDQARALFEAAGVELADSAVECLHSRTEGWVAGLRLAALSLAAHPDPNRFAAEFCGSERTVAEYLLTEVLERQPEEVRRLLLRTSVLERVSGPLADVLTGGSGGERILHDLEAAGAFVVALDVQRSWFRYHRLFADLLRLQLRSTAPGELPALHAAAAGWFAENGYPVEAVRHAQAAEDWGLAARLLSDHWFGIVLNGQSATAHELLTGFPVGAIDADAEFTALVAGDELNRGSLEEAARQLALATEGLASVPAERRERLHILLTILRLSLARQCGDFPVVAEEAQRLLGPAADPDAAQPGLGEDLRVLALMNLGIAELWSLRLDEAERHLEQGVALARRIGRPNLEVSCLAHGAMVARLRSPAGGEEWGRQAIELARRHGWSEEPIAAVADAALGAAMVWQGRLAEAESWLQHADDTLRADVEPATVMLLHFSRGLLEMARGRDQKALAAFRAAEGLAGRLISPHPLATRMRAFLLHTRLRLGEIEHVDAALAEMDSRERETREMCTVIAALRLAQDDPRAAITALAPVLDGSAPVTKVRNWLAQAILLEAILLEAIARDMLGDQAAAGRALKRALDVAEPDRVLIPFLVHPVAGLLERHARQRTPHATLVSKILSLLAGTSSPGADGPPVSREDRGRIALPEKTLREPLSQAETRVLRYLPTSLTVPEIADQIYLSVNTLRTHMRHIYDKLGAHRRHEAVERARTLGLLASSARMR
jgi:LuxR family maltose regulon positive regulatory protein